MEAGVIGHYNDYLWGKRDRGHYTYIWEEDSEMITLNKGHRSDVFGVLELTKRYYQNIKQIIVIIIVIK